MKLTQRIFLLVLITVSLSTLANFLLSQYQEEALHNDSEKILARTIIQSMRDALVQDVIDGNKLRVTNLLRRLKEHDNPIEFLYVTKGEQQAVFAHSFRQGFPRYLLSSDTLQAQTGIRQTGRYQTELGLIYKYSEPLIAGLDTTLHIGINQSEIAQQLASNKRSILLMSFLITLLALAIAYFWSKQITAPLVNFTEQVKRFGAGEKVDFDKTGKSVLEIRLLASAFQAAIDERQQALAALQEREQDLEITLNSIGDAVIATDASGNITRLNPVAEQLTGWSLEEAKGLSVKSIFPIVDASTRETIENPIEKVLSTGETVYLSNHTTLISRDGREYQIADSAAPIRNEDNHVLGMVLVFNDVTEQYQLRQAVIRSEKQYQTLATVAPVGIYYTDKDGSCLYVNEKWCEITGIPAEQALGDGWIKGLHPEDRKSIFAEWGKAAKAGLPFQLEYRFQNDKGVCWVLGQALAEKSDDGEVMGYVGTITDISDRKQAEESVRTSAQAMADAQRIAHVGSWELNLPTNELSWSDEIYRIFDIEPENFVATYDAFINMVHPDDRERVKAAYEESIKKKKPYAVDHRLRLADGSIKHVHEHGQTFYDEAGNAIRSSGTVQDITARVIMEESLRRTEKMDALGKLTGGIAHDYNNMLGVVLGYTDLLESMVSDQPRLANYVLKIRHAGERGAQLTAKLMTFSRQKISDAERLDINALLLAAQDMLEKTLTVRIKLVLDLANDLWPVWLDNSDLEDAIINLSINASHAIDGSGQLTIQTRNDILDEKSARRLQLPVGEYVRLSVIDTGCGMDAITREKIFEPFFSTKGSSGTGLGLSQVYGFVERSRGAIEVSSEPGHGTEITIYFPRYMEADSVETFEEQSGTVDFSGDETILVVDDEQALLDLACEALSRQGYQILAANNAQQVLDILEQQKVDLLFCDIIMPDMDGYELACIVREKYPEIKIQLASGFTDDHHVGMIDDELHKNLLYKPYHSQALLKRIRKLLDNQ